VKVEKLIINKHMTEAAGAASGSAKRMAHGIL
jgi:hypothetical protein